MCCQQKSRGGGVCASVSVPFKSLSGVPLTLARQQSALHSWVAHLLLVSRQQPAAADLSHQPSDKPPHTERVRVIRTAEVEGQALLVHPPVGALS